MPGEWAGTAEAYARSFALLCAGAVDAVLDAVAERTPPPASLLDVGTGPGTLARAATARGWDVEACDPEPGMVALAVRSGVRAREAGLPHLRWPDRAVDAVCANFVVNHTSRPRDAIAELARVARGTVAFTIWPRRRTVLNGLWSGVVADAEARPIPGATLPPEDDIDRSEEGLTAVLTGLGLAEVRVTTLEWDFAIAPAVLWSGVEGGAGTIGTTHRAQDTAARARMTTAYRARTAELLADDGLLHLPSFGLLAVASVVE